eukprot:5079691-Prymnesium_polylepis.2
MARWPALRAAQRSHPVQTTEPAREGRAPIGAHVRRGPTQPEAACKCAQVLRFGAASLLCCGGLEAAQSPRGCSVADGQPCELHHTRRAAVPPSDSPQGRKHEMLCSLGDIYG